MPRPLASLGTGRRVDWPAVPDRGLRPAADHGRNAGGAAAAQLPRRAAAQERRRAPQGRPREQAGGRAAPVTCLFQASLQRCNVCASL